MKPNDFDKRPVATVSVLTVTGILTVLQYVFPPLLPLLERTPSALARHEWWRLFTPLFVHSDGLRQVAFNFPAIPIVGILVERIFGHVRWIVIYFTCGLVGEVAGYVWRPTGAGASVAGAGLLGSLAFWLLHNGKVVQAQIGGGIILVGSLILVYFHDIHGPPILADALLAFMMKTHEEKPSTGSILPGV